MADNDTITIKTSPPDLIERTKRYPNKVRFEMEKTGQQALHHVWGSIPSYPPQQPTDYIRKGTLGRSLGVSQSGSPLGTKPDVFTYKALGGTQFEARLGTRLQYAPHVIGTGTQARHMKQRNWWTMADVAQNARKGVIRLYQNMARRLAYYFDRNEGDIGDF